MNNHTCPTRGNIIDCSECDFECKLRMITKDVQTDTEIPPESQPADIYY